LFPPQALSILAFSHPFSKVISINMTCKKKKQPKQNQKMNEGVRPMDSVTVECCHSHNCPEDIIDCEEAKKDYKLSVSLTTANSKNDSKAMVEILSGLEDCVDQTELATEDDELEISHQNKTSTKNRINDHKESSGGPTSSSSTKFSVIFFQWILPVTLILLMALVAAALSIVLFGYFKEDEESNRMAGIDQVDAIKYLNDVQDYLTKKGVTSYEDFIHPDNSPQAQASEWLAWMDPAQVDIPRSDASSTEVYEFVSRYIVATLYFATNGPSWYNQINFLSQDSVCSWQGISTTTDVSASEEEDDVTTYGVTCNDDGKVIEINLGKYYG
jgi:hypothetical protein